MSNTINEQLLGNTQEACVEFSEVERVNRNAKHLGACATVHLSDELGFADIFSGRVPIDIDSVIFDRSGVQVDTAELLTYVEPGVEV